MKLFSALCFGHRGDLYKFNACKLWVHSKYCKRENAINNEWMCPKCKDLRTYGEKLADLDFADDMALMADVEVLQTLTDRLYTLKLISCV